MKSHWIIWIGILLGITASSVGSTVLIPIILAVALFFLLDPAVSWLESKKISRKLTTPIIVLFCSLIVYAVAPITYGAFSSLYREIPQYSEKIKGAVKSFQGAANQFQKGTENFIPKKSPTDSDVTKVEVVSDKQEGWTSKILTGLGSAFEVITDLVLIPILTVFFLLEKYQLRNSLVKIGGSDFPTQKVGKETAEMIRGFFLGNIVVGLGTSLGFYILFTILGLDNKIALSLSSGFLNLVPLLGAVLGALFPIAQSFLQDGKLNSILILLGGSVFLHFFVNNVIIPKIVGSRVNINASAATVGIIFWGWLWGGLGLLLAVPLTAFIRIVLSSRPSTEAWGLLLSEDVSHAATKIQLSLKKTAKSKK
jgi:predicted PurR-regulated permease PerM